MNNQELAAIIVEKVGGKGNIKFVTNCMTRLRFKLTDLEKVDTEGIKALDGVMGVTYKGGQYQLIIGPHVATLFDEVSQLLPKELLELEEEREPVEQPKGKLSIKGIIDNVMDVIGSCVAPMLPIITAAGLIKMIVAILGPAMLNVLPETNNFIQLLTFVGDAGFYFFPVYVAYAGAKKFETNIPLALFIAGIMLHPALFSIVEAGNPFTVYGIPMILTTYATSFIPMILITWVMSYVEKFLVRIIPSSLKALLFPLSLILIMLPIALCVLGPIGTVLGQGIASAITSLHQVLGPVAIGLVAALWPLLIVTGMHQALIAIALTHIASQGFDSSILVGAVISNYSMIAIALVFLIKAKTAKNRAYASSSLITLTLGGISEPTLFGIILRYKKAIVYLLIAGFAGGVYAGLMNVVVYFIGVGNILVSLGFAGANSSSLVHGIIGSVITFVVAFALSMVFGFGPEQEEEELERKGAQNEKLVVSE